MYECSDVIPGDGWFKCGTWGWDAFSFSFSTYEFAIFIFDSTINVSDFTFNVYVIDFANNVHVNDFTVNVAHTTINVIDITANVFINNRWASFQCATTSTSPTSPRCPLYLMTGSAVSRCPQCYFNICYLSYSKGATVVSSPSPRGITSRCLWRWETLFNSSCEEVVWANLEASWALLKIFFLLVACWS